MRNVKEFWLKEVPVSPEERARHRDSKHVPGPDLIVMTRMKNGNDHWFLEQFDATREEMEWVVETLNKGLV